MSRILITIILGAFPALALAAERPPNFVVVLADDIGAKELACYGHPRHQTPRLDRLAKEGVRFETCWATPLCTPTRVMLMTGQYGFHSGYFHMFGNPWSPRPDSVEYAHGDKLTFADLLKSQGYATGMAGKWQLSGEHPTLIHDCGFDTYRMWAYEHNLPAGVKHTGRYEGAAGGRTARYWHPSIVENGKYLETKPTDYGPDLFNAFAIDFVRQHKDRPFCFYYTMPLTHGPHEETPDPAHPGQRRPAGYQSNVEYLDYLMGQLLDAIEAAGLADNTVFIFVGDNGTAGSGKGTVTELGVRVPLMIRWPGAFKEGNVKPGIVSRELVSVADIFPTLAEIAGAKLPAGHVIDGRSLVPTLRGEGTKHRDWVFSYLGPGRIIRDERWLLEVPGRGQPERLYDCGDSRTATGYKDVSDSTAADAMAARERFTAILKDLPGPEGHPGLKQPSGDGAGKAKKKGKGKKKAAAD
ncbi:MAG: sulfatase-like hydrolase/transferase [Planctomycetaceae bacterium]|nr:sulfatase-like hydrolase/transferase [Planctomycetaceae bacterium]